jgi:hypothetical protein
VAYYAVYGKKPKRHKKRFWAKKAMLAWISVNKKLGPFDTYVVKPGLKLRFT